MEACNFLFQPGPAVRHELCLTVIPQFVPMGDGSRYPTAGRLKRVLANGLRGKRRQFTVPVNDLRRVSSYRIHAVTFSRTRADGRDRSVSESANSLLRGS
jgi:hypothetical protein